ncbi:Polysaccharide export protein [Pyrenophora tritici-repentis]|nr:Polysaccharide export protein [Pyrenophora tritici-repentis]
MYWNGEQALRSYWNDAVIALANALGRENVFVTVYENGSWDDSKGALRELDMALAAHQIRRNITLSETTHLDEISVVNRGSGWVDTPRGRRELRRIPYLSRLRNWTLESLQELARQGERFDKVLFLNDVMFEVEDVFRLLHTNNGDFAAACSLDFSSPPQLYDTFALRDAEGHEPLMQTWPYFRARESRRAMLRNHPVPVTSCWNGIDNPLRAEKRTYVNPQPLDVVMFAPLAAAYKAELASFLNISQGLTSITKRDFYRLFNAAWTSSFTETLVTKAFAATGLHPFEPDAILRRFSTATPSNSRPSSSNSTTSLLSASDWRKIERLLRQAVDDIYDTKSKKLSQTIYTISVKNTLLQHENSQLKETLVN